MPLSSHASIIPFDDLDFLAYMQAGPVKGKLVNNNKTRKELGWEPAYPNYKEFMEKIGAEDIYTKTSLGKLGMKHA